MMSEDVRKHVRTQGKYSDIGKIKNRDKRQKISPGAKEPPEKKNYNRYSSGSKESNSSFTDENISPVKYEENSDYSFEQLEESKKPIEIYKQGKKVLSTTENGDSIIIFEPHFLEEEKSDEYFDRLFHSIAWHTKNIVINGEEKPQPRLVSWFGPYPYSYSGSTLEPATMPDCVLEIKTKVEEYLKENGMNVTFNSVLLNQYRTGKDSVAWHSDDELSMGICPTIASVSLGETRKFEMKPKKKYSEDDSPREKQAYYFVYLTHGSLLIMDGSMQDDWQHRVPKEYHDKYPRINLTFRTVYPLEKAPNKVPVREFKKKQVHNVWGSNKMSSCKSNFQDDDFPPLNSDKNSSPSLSTDKNFPPLSSDENFPPLGSDENSPLLSKNVNPSFVHPNSDVKSNFHDSVSNSSFKDDDCNRSFGYWDSETSFEEKLNIKKELENSYFTPDRSSATNDVKHAEKIMDETGKSYDEKLNLKKELENYHFISDSSSTANDVKYVEKIMDETGKSYDEKLNLKKELENYRFISDSSSTANDVEKIIDESGNAFEMIPVETHVANSAKAPSTSEDYLNNKEPQKKSLNVLAKEFIPNIAPRFDFHDYSRFPLEDLIYYEVNLMHDKEQLKSFSNNLKIKITEKLPEFPRSVREELEVLCLITDGSQTDQNQKIISSRMCNVVLNNIRRPQTSPDMQKSFDRPLRSQGYGKVNYTDTDRPPRLQNYAKLNQRDIDRPSRSQSYGKINHTDRDRPPRSQNYGNHADRERKYYQNQERGNAHRY